MPRRNLTPKDYAKFRVINKRGRARVARGQPYFNPRRSVGQQIDVQNIAQQEEEEDEPQPGTSSSQPESATTTPAKRRRATTDNSVPEEILSNPAVYTMDVVDTPMQDEPTSETNTISAGKNNDIMSVMWKSPTNYETVIQFERTFDIFSWAHTFLWEDIKIDGIVSGRMLTTSFMYLLNNTLATYMSPGDFKSLPPYARAMSLHLSIKCMGAEPSFETGSTLSGNASINHIIYGGFVKGLNKVFNVIPRVPQYQQGTMTVTKTETLKYDNYKIALYGKNNDQSEYPCALGLPRNYPSYTSIITNFGEPTSANVFANKKQGVPDLTKYIHKFKLNDILNKNIDWSWKCTNGVIKMPQLSHGITTKKDRYVAFNANTIGLENLINSKGETTIDITDSNTRSGNVNFTYDQWVDKGPYIGQFNKSHESVPIVDTLSIGLFPVPNNCKDCANTYVNCKGHWNITTKIVLEIGRNTNNTYSYFMPHECEFFVPSNLTLQPDELYNAPYTDSGTGFLSDLTINSQAIGGNLSDSKLETVVRIAENAYQNVIRNTQDIQNLKRDININASSSVGSGTNVNVNTNVRGGKRN